MSRAKPAPVFRELPLELIREPELPMRETFDEDALYELTESIRQFGVIQPIVVTPAGDRFQIEDGHRRYIASIRAERKTIPAIVRLRDVHAAEAMKVHANFFREDVNPGECAVYLNELLTTRCDGDVDRLCKLTGLKRSYIEDRLLLLQGEPEILAAVKAKQIGLGVARELQRFRDRGDRLMYLDAALRGGATVALVKSWRAKADLIPTVPPPDTGDGTNQFSGSPAPIMKMLCVLCESDEAPWEMELLYVHGRCRRLFLDRFLAQLRGEAPAAPAPQPGGDHAG